MNRHRFAPGVGIGLGIALGAALGAAFGNVGIGIGIGLAFGIIFAGASRRARSEDAESNGRKAPPDSN